MHEGFSKDAEAVAQKHRRNMNIYLNSIKLLRDNFVTLLSLYELLNYESSSMRNNHILKITLSLSQKSFAIFAVIVTKKKIERKTRNYQTLNTLSIMIQHYNSIL